MQLNYEEMPEYKYFYYREKFEASRNLEDLVSQEMYENILRTEYHYTDELLKLYRDAAHCGNEDAIIAFNNSVVRMDFADEELAKIAASAKRYMDKLVLVDKAAREGNEIARKAFEISDTPMKYRYSTYEDYTAGESSFFGEIPFKLSFTPKLFVILPVGPLPLIGL